MASSVAPLSEPLTGPTKAMFCVAVTDDGEWITGGDADNGIWVWRKDEAKPWWFNTAAHAGPVHAVVLTPDTPPEDESEPEEPAEEGDGDEEGGDEEAGG